MGRSPCVRSEGTRRTGQRAHVGLDMARSSYVLFHDSDVELPPAWIERALAHMAADPALGVVGGYMLYGFIRVA